MKDLLNQLLDLMPLAAAATEGPWREEMDYEDNWTPMILSDHGLIAIVEDINFGSTRQEDREAYPDQMEDNAAFIADARNLLTPENLTRLVAALAPQWVAVADLPATLEEKFLYVLLPNNKVMQAMHTDFFTDDFEGQAWGQYTDIDCIDPLPVQPTHYFTPPTAPTA